MDAKAISPAPPPCGVPGETVGNARGMAVSVAVEMGTSVSVGLLVTDDRGMAGTGDANGVEETIGIRVFVDVGTRIGIAELIFAGTNCARNKLR